MTNLLHSPTTGRTGASGSLALPHTDGVQLVGGSISYRGAIERIARMQRV